MHYFYINCQSGKENNKIKIMKLDSKQFKKN